MGLIIVTGAASGIGLAVCNRLRNRPDTRLVLVDQNTNQLVRISGSNLSDASHAIDASDPDAIQNVIDTSISGGRQLDAIVICAGISCTGSATELEVSRWKKTIEINTLGLMYAIRSAIPPMVKQGYGTIIAIASIAGKVSYVGEPAYVASKYAVVGFCDSVRKELIGTGIRVSIIEPGFVDSPMTRNQPAMAKRMNKIKALETEDIARVIEFILDQPPHCSISEVMIRPTEQEL